MHNQPNYKHHIFHFSHLEQFGFQVRHVGEVTQKHEELIIEKGRNQNFIHMLKQASDNGIVNIEHTILEMGCCDQHNPGSLAIWYSDRQ